MNSDVIDIPKETFDNFLFYSSLLYFIGKNCKGFPVNAPLMWNGNDASKITITLCVILLLPHLNWNWVVDETKSVYFLFGGYESFFCGH